MNLNKMGEKELKGLLGLAHLTSDLKTLKEVEAALAKEKEKESIDAILAAFFGLDEIEPESEPKSQEATNQQLLDRVKAETLEQIPEMELFNFVENEIMKTIAPSAKVAYLVDKYSSMIDDLVNEAKQAKNELDVSRFLASVVTYSLVIDDLKKIF